MANLGYVGLGVMGGRMTDRAKAADVTFVMVTDSTALDKTKAAGFPIIFVTDPWGTTSN